MIDNKRILTIVITIIILLCAGFYLIIGITEAHFVSKYNNYEEKEWNIWTIIFLNCIVDVPMGLLPIVVIPKIKKIINNENNEDNEDNDEDDNNFGKIMLGPIMSALLSIITIYIYFNIPNVWRDHWQKNTPELWIFIEIHFVIAWIYIVLIITTIIIYVLYYNKIKIINHQYNINEIELQTQTVVSVQI
jgi:NADH:ubiquinone oxidoreductase subunit 5 (subunit L)/multisubunit Na+/H+ antiporter MnhA subunit